MGNGPIERIKSYPIEVAIWQHEGENGPYFTTSVQRSYKNKQGEWQQTTSFRRQDLLVLSHLLGKAYDTIEELEDAARSRQRSVSRPVPDSECPY